MCVDIIYIDEHTVYNLFNIYFNVKISCKYKESYLFQRRF